MRWAVLVGALGIGCTAITGDFSDVVGIEYSGSLSPSVEENDTLTLSAVALDIKGNPLPDVPVIWRILALDTDTVPFEIDSLTGLVTGLFAGTGRVQGDADGLRTPLITVKVIAVPDSIAAVEPTIDTVDAGVTESAVLVTQVFDISPTGTVTALANQSVRYTVVSPAAGTPEAAEVAIGISGQPTGTDPLSVVTTTSGSGSAFVTARRVGPMQPDSAVIEAVALTSAGTIVPGSPARFTIFFLSL